jgi:hypothetical protein
MGFGLLFKKFKDAKNAPALHTRMQRKEGTAFSKKAA